MNNLIVDVPRLPYLREAKDAERLARAAAASAGIVGDPVVTEINDYPSHFSPVRDPQGWRFEWETHDEA